MIHLILCILFFVKLQFREVQLRGFVFVMLRASSLLLLSFIFARSTQTADIYSYVPVFPSQGAGLISVVKLFTRLNPRNIRMTLSTASYVW